MEWCNNQMFDKKSTASASVAPYSYSCFPNDNWKKDLESISNIEDQETPLFASRYYDDSNEMENKRNESPSNLSERNVSPSFSHKVLSPKAHPLSQSSVHGGKKNKEEAIELRARSKTAIQLPQSTGSVKIHKDSNLPATKYLHSSMKMFKRLKAYEHANLLQDDLAFSAIATFILESKNEGFTENPFQFLEKKLQKSFIKALKYRLSLLPIFPEPGEGKLTQLTRDVDKICGNILLIETLDSFEENRHDIHSHRSPPQTNFLPSPSRKRVENKYHKIKRENSEKIESLSFMSKDKSTRTMKQDSLPPSILKSPHRRSRKLQEVGIPKDQKQKNENHESPINIHKGSKNVNIEKSGKKKSMNQIEELKCPENPTFFDIESQKLKMAKRRSVLMLNEAKAMGEQSKIRQQLINEMKFATDALKKSKNIEMNVAYEQHMKDLQSELSKWCGYDDKTKQEDRFKDVYTVDSQGKSDNQISENRNTLRSPVEVKTERTAPIQIINNNEGTVRLENSNSQSQIKSDNGCKLNEVKLDVRQASNESSKFSTAKNKLQIEKSNDSISSKLDEENMQNMPRSVKSKTLDRNQSMGKVPSKPNSIYGEVPSIVPITCSSESISSTLATRDKEKPLKTFEKKSRYDGDHMHSRLWNHDRGIVYAKNADSHWSQDHNRQYRRKKYQDNYEHGLHPRYDINRSFETQRKYRYESIDDHTPRQYGAWSGKFGHEKNPRDMERMRESQWRENPEHAPLSRYTRNTRPSLWRDDEGYDLTVERKDRKAYRGVSEENHASAESKIVKVVAPANLPQNSQFAVSVGNKEFTVVVPKGGVKEGQVFSSPVITIPKRFEDRPSVITSFSQQASVEVQIASDLHAAKSKSKEGRALLHQTSGRSVIRCGSSDTDTKMSGNLIEVLAPKSLSGGQKLKIELEDEIFVVFVPKGGVEKGEKFSAAARKYTGSVETSEVTGVIEAKKDLNIRESKAKDSLTVSSNGRHFNKQESDLSTCTFINESMPIISVVAPNNLPSGSQFEAEMSGIIYLVTVPEGGVVKGEIFKSCETVIIKDRNKFISVLAPDNMNEGSTFEAQLDNNFFIVTVPKGGVKEGEIFSSLALGISDQKKTSISLSSTHSASMKKIEEGNGLKSKGEGSFIMHSFSSEKILNDTPRRNASSSLLVGRNKQPKEEVEQEKETKRLEEKISGTGPSFNTAMDKDKQELDDNIEGLTLGTINKSRPTQNEKSSVQNPNEFWKRAFCFSDTAAGIMEHKNSN